MLRSITRSDSSQSGSGAKMTTSRRTGSMDSSCTADRSAGYKAATSYGSNHGLHNNVTSIPFGVLTSTNNTGMSSTVSTTASSKMTKITLSPSSSVNHYNCSQQQQYQIIPRLLEEQQSQRLPQPSSRSHSLTLPSPPLAIHENHYEYVVNERSHQSPHSSQSQLFSQNQGQNVKTKVNPMVVAGRMIPVNSAVAFTPVSSSSSSSGTNSNCPSVPTTPESQSSERLSNITQSQPDLSKLQELEIYLSRANIGLDNHNDIMNHLQSQYVNNNAGQSYTHESLYHNQSSINGSGNSVNHPVPQESIYSNSQLSHSQTSGVNSSGSNINDSLNHLNSQYNSNNVMFHHQRRGSDASSSSPGMNHSLPPPSPPKNSCPDRYSNNIHYNNRQQQHQYEHEYQNQHNLNEFLIFENRQLKSEIESLKKRVAQLDRLEKEVCLVHAAHEEYQRAAENKEKLERAVRYKLEVDIKRLQAENRELRQQNSQALDVAIAAATAHNALNRNNTTNAIVTSQSEEGM